MNVRRSTAKASAVVTAVVLALGLSACGRGFDSPTDQIYNPPIGVNEQSGTVDVLNAVIVTDGTNAGSGTLVATLVNNDQKTDDTLTNISGAGGDQVQVSPPSVTSIKAGDVLSLLDTGGAKVEGDAVKPGFMVSLTFTFANAEAVDVDVPVYLNEGPFSEVPVS
ncbi:MAG: hypothetical protein ACTHKG_17245 [Nocardioides sp.]